MRKWDPETVRQRISSAIGLILYAETSKTIIWALDLAGCDMMLLLDTELKDCGSLEELRDKSVNLLIEKEEFYEALHRN